MLFVMYDMKYVSTISCCWKHHNGAGKESFLHCEGVGAIPASVDGLTQSEWLGVYNDSYFFVNLLSGETLEVLY
jgi:hypothetical protein